MVVNSLSFLVFFLIVFAVYYLPTVRKKVSYQNLWLLVASYFFYGYADIRMIPLLFGATAVFYFIGEWLKREMKRNRWKRASLITTIGTCLGVGILLYFKYLGFFADSFGALLHSMGFNVPWSTLHIVLPIGVSFFTFKLISYVIEIHRERIEPCRNFIDFAVYISFFPTILSGPIDRPNKFIPQLTSNRTFNYELAVDGCRQILWGMFTKMCISDNLSTVTDKIWASQADYSPSALLLVALLYPIQMYADFDGYSNMAIGVGKILGLRIARNFNHPFIARNIAEYWRNWHISLTGWLTDYVFSPLNIAFRNLGKIGIILAIVINFILIGFWHGANWTYGLFGLYHGLLYIPLIMSGAFGKRKKLKPGRLGLPKVGDFGKMLLVFCLVAFGLIIFRAPSLGAAWTFIGNAFHLSALNMPAGFRQLPFTDIKFAYTTLCFVFILLITEWTCRKKEFALQIKDGTRLAQNKALRWTLYVLVIVVTLMCKGTDSQFIYFQF